MQKPFTLLTYSRGLVEIYFFYIILFFFFSSVGSKREGVAHLPYGGNMWSACACQVGRTPYPPRVKKEKVLGEKKK